MSQIHEALSKAQDELCRLGIAKLSKNAVQNYAFRGIEAAMNEASPILVRCGITVTPKYSELTIVERVKGDPGDGKATRFATIKGAFTFAAADGSNVTSEVYGEAMDSGDKAVVKAQSVAFRTALFQQFVIPTMAMDPESSEYGAQEDPPELEAARARAMEGSAALETWWRAQTKEIRVLLASHLPSLKTAGLQADRDTQ